MAESTCRVCLGSNIRLIPVQNSKLIDIYQKLTSTKLNTDGATDALCYICHMQLKRCSIFADMALETEAHLLRTGSEIKHRTSTLLDHSLIHNLSTRPIQFLTVNEQEITVKLEHEDAMGHHFLGIENTKTINFENESNKVEEDFFLGVGDGKTIFVKETNEKTGGLQELGHIKGIGEFVDVKCNNSDSDDYFSNLVIDEECKKKPSPIPTYIYCDFCNKRFTFKYKLMVHLRTHTDKPRPLKCDKCDVTFSHHSALVAHTKTHDTTETYTCKICSETFNTKVRLTSHILTHTGEWQYKCELCLKVFIKPADLKRHSTQAHGPYLFTCSFCNKGFNKHASFRAHLTAHSARPTHVCNICDKRFSLAANLKRHIQTHIEERPTYPCPKCKKIFNHNHHLRDHLRIHSGEKPYICKICDKAFCHSSTLRNHMVIHTGEKPFVCHKCLSPFSQTSTLRRHLRLVHGSK